MKPVLFDVINDGMVNNEWFHISEHISLSLSLGHGPFSHLFDGMFIPKVLPDLPVKWKVLKDSPTAFPKIPLAVCSETFHRPLSGNTLKQANLA